MEIEDLIKRTRDKSRKLDALQESLRSFNEMKKHLQGEKTTENQEKNLLVSIQLHVDEYEETFDFEKEEYQFEMTSELIDFLISQIDKSIAGIVADAIAEKLI